ncbi:MAG: sulfur carrier protein ThiS [Gammaproteobacteria bacterium]|nr:sulfur carrier protein ThiS [Gammaproteobacteria bacterium]
MEIVVNGESRTIRDNYTVAHLIKDLGLTEGRLAVEVNLEIVPRSQHPQHMLKSGDRVEIVHAIGGGAA